MLKQIISIEALYVFLPLLFLCFDVYGIVSQFIRISRDYKGELAPYSEISRSISENLGARPIADLRLIKQGNCPRGYELWQVGVWPGTKEGCYNKNNGTLLSGGCYLYASSAEEMEEWKRIPMYSREALYDWGGYWLCVLRYPDFRFVDFNTSSCAVGYKKCSKGLLCVPETNIFPITSISFEWEGNGWGLVINTERDPDQNAAVNVSTSVNSMPCISSQKASKTENTLIYPLDNEGYEGCSKFGIDEEFSRKIDSEDLIQLYADNRLSGYYKTLPNYADYLQGKSVSLYYKTKINLNITPECSIRNIVNQLGDINMNIQNFSLMTSITTVLIAYNVIILVVGFIMFLYLCLNRENDERGKYLKEQKCLLHTFHFIPYIIGLLYITQYSVQPKSGSFAASNMIGNATTIIDNQCFMGNQYHNVLVQFRDDVTEMTAYFYGANVTMAIISYIFIGSMLLIRGFRGYYRREVEQYENLYLEKRFIPTRPQPETELTSTDYEYEIEEYEEAPYVSYEDQDEEER